MKPEDQKNPSPGAMRAAREIMTADDPARFTADFAADQEQIDMADIIDRQTAAKGLAWAAQGVLGCAHANVAGMKAYFIADERMAALRAAVAANQFPDGPTARVGAVEFVDWLAEVNRLLIARGGEEIKPDFSCPEAYEAAREGFEEGATAQDYAAGCYVEPDDSGAR